uniref:3-oxoacyl-[acyl-carrier-protein] reductase n=1 Tax=candidate division WOR-3 bacterium TaxID=2052148 RepID=A0A7C4Y4N9_UNCW3
MRLKDKVGIITGGARGIGKTIAIRFLEEGAKIAITDIIVEDGENFVKEAKEKGYEIIFFKCDVSNLQEVEKTVDEIYKIYGKIDILVNNAGITRDNIILRMTEEDFDKVIDVNLKGTFNFTKSVLKYMSKAKYGKIINISSIIGIMGNAGQSNYAASKAGIIGFTKSIAKEFGKRNIQVNAIAPGFIKTPMTERLPDNVKEEYFKAIPLGRFGEVEDVANLALFLASSESDYITGQVIQVDGGLLT